MINGEPIKPEDRDLKSKLEKDADDNAYLWEYDNTEIEEGTGCTVSGWIGALDKSLKTVNKEDRGIVLMARGKLVQDPSFFMQMLDSNSRYLTLLGNFMLNL